MIEETEARIEQRVTLETLADRVPAVADLIGEHAAAVEACRMASQAFRTSRLNLEADPMDIGAQAARSELQRAIEAVHGIAERYG